MKNKHYCQIYQYDQERQDARQLPAIDMRAYIIQLNDDRIFVSQLQRSGIGFI